MSTGLKIVNASGFIQIDADYTNYALYAKGTVTSGSGGRWVVPLPLNMNHVPLVFVRAPFTDRWVIGQVFASKGNWTNGYVIAHGHVLNNALTAGISGQVLEYAVFIKNPPTTTPSGYGLLVKKSDGTTVFDSSSNQLRVSAVTNLHPWRNNSSAYKTYVIPNETNPWIQLVPSIIGFYEYEWDVYAAWFIAFRYSGSGSLNVASAKYDGYFDAWSGATYAATYYRSDQADFCAIATGAYL